MSFDKDRLSRLSGKMGVIMCGGFSQVEMYENREKIVDALNSTKSALINVKGKIFKNLS